jgi:hypothetical protein
VDLKKAFARGGDRGARGEPADAEATIAETEKLAERLCRLVDQGKHDKACRQLVTWLNGVGLPGALYAVDAGDTGHVGEPEDAVDG